MPRTTHPELHRAGTGRGELLVTGIGRLFGAVI